MLIYCDTIHKNKWSLIKLFCNCLLPFDPDVFQFNW